MRVNIETGKEPIRGSLSDADDSWSGVGCSIEALYDAKADWEALAECALVLCSGFHITGRNSDLTWCGRGDESESTQVMHLRRFN